MKTFLLLTLAASLFVFSFSCKKSSNTPSSTKTYLNASIGSDAFTFDSVVAEIDTTDAYPNVYFITLTGNDSKTGNYLYLSATHYPDKTFTGNYIYDNSDAPPNTPYSRLSLGDATLYTGAYHGDLNIAGMHVSNLMISSMAGNRLQGSFSVMFNPLPYNSSPDTTVKYTMTGKFDAPFKYPEPSIDLLLVPCYSRFNPFANF